MKLPWKKEEVKSGSSVMFALSQLGSARWGARSNEALMRDGYMRNAVVHRCVQLVAQAAASVPFHTEHAQTAALIERPMPEASRVDFLSNMYAHLMLSGNAYLEAVIPEGADGPKGLQVLRPDRMTAELNTRGWIDGWTYKVERKSRLIGRTEDGWLPVLHLKSFHPCNDVYGYSPLAAARQALDMHNAGADWAKALIDNSAKPSGALVYGADGARLTDEQFARLKSELETAHTGVENAGRPLLLEGGLDWKPMSLSPAEMDFLAARNGAAREIALTLGVPPQILGIPGDNTYSNYKEANAAFWRMTIIPLVSRMAVSLGRWLGECYGANVTLRCDLDMVPALAEERDLLWSRLEAATFVSDDEKRALAGFAPRETTASGQAS